MKSASLIAAAVVGCVACDSQVTPGYEGEPLLVVRGSIGRVGGEQLDPTLQPAIGWYVKGDDTHLRIEDVRVEGEFPANFTLELLEPPPDHVLMEADGAQIAWGHIIAVQPDRPDEVAQANEGGESAQCDQSNQCQVQRHWCREDDCYRERLTCERSLDPEKEYEDASCTLLSSEGNPELKVSTWDHIKGLSGNYIMLYTSVPFPAGTHLANSFNDNEPIPSGLHLVSLREYTPTSSPPATAATGRSNPASSPPTTVSTAPPSRRSPRWKTGPSINPARTPSMRSTSFKTSSPSKRAVRSARRSCAWWTCAPRSPSASRSRPT